MNIQELALRIAIGFIVLLILTRIMGRKEISQMTFFNFASSITIGSIAATLVLSSDVSIRNGVIALIGWAFFTLLMDGIDIKTIRGRHIINGNPLIIVKNGRIVEKAMLNSRFDLDSLTSMLRQQGVFSIAEVDYAILETNGKLSILKKDEHLYTTKSDMKIAPRPRVYSLPAVIISDGAVIKTNLIDIDRDYDWLLFELKKHGIDNVKDVFFAQMQMDGTLYVEKKQI